MPVLALVFLSSVSPVPFLGLPFVPLHSILDGHSSLLLGVDISPIFSEEAYFVKSLWL
jgi:hypothetical protein